MTTTTTCSRVAFLFCVSVGAARADATLDAMATTLDAAFQALRTQPAPAYHLAYAVVEEDERTIQATHGALAADDVSQRRVLDVDLRVGDMHRDNTHKLRDAGWFSEPDRPSWRAPITGPLDALTRMATRGTDDLYRSARRRLEQVRANDAVKVALEDPSDDFSPASAVVHLAPPTFTDVPDWHDRVRAASALYLDHPAVHDSAVQLSISRTTRWLVTSEGTRILDGRAHFRFSTWASTVAEDGMELSVYDYVDVATIDHLPDDAAVRAMVEGVAERLTQLRAAPIADPWSGPAILRGRAAGVFFHEIFGHRMEGHRQKDEDEGQTFTRRMNLPVLPSFLSVTDDPTLARYAGEDLNGHYAHDDEGVPAQKVSLVDRGVLRSFLLSRSPVAGFPQSNGHGRREPGNAVVARQGNLIVESSQTVPYAELRKKLIEEAKRQKREFGLIFDDISGGFTFTGRATPQAFDVMPVTVWRVYVDGRPDELIRGVDLIGTPLTTFSRITAAADDPQVFNGICGAESGWVPVSAAAPSLLVSEVEIQRRSKENARPPLLPAPGRAE